MTGKYWTNSTWPSWLSPRGWLPPEAGALESSLLAGFPWHLGSRNKGGQRSKERRGTNGEGGGGRRGAAAVRGDRTPQESCVLLISFPSESLFLELNVPNLNHILNLTSLLIISDTRLFTFFPLPF